MRKPRLIYVAIGAVVVAGLAGYLHWSRPRLSAELAQYNPTINPNDFVPQVTNKYFALKPGTKFTYIHKTWRGRERDEVLVTHETKKVMGITTMVVRDRVWLNDQLIEDARDWYAQDKAGNVWYFGEAVDNYQDGKIKNHRGSWEAGVNGAKPGIIMLANPKVGDTYRQEYYKGHAEDMGTIVAVGKKVTVPHGTFGDCLQVRDWSTLDWTNEYKYFCPNVGFIALEESALLPTGRAELVGVSTE